MDNLKDRIEVNDHHPYRDQPLGGYLGILEMQRPFWGFEISDLETFFGARNFLADLFG